MHEPWFSDVLVVRFRVLCFSHGHRMSVVYTCALVVCLPSSRQQDGFVIASFATSNIAIAAMSKGVMFSNGVRAQVRWRGSQSYIYNTLAVKNAYSQQAPLGPTAKIQSVGNLSSNTSKLIAFNAVSGRVYVS